MESAFDGHNVSSRAWSGTDRWICAALLAIGGAARFAFTAAQELSTFDPWRHLLLIESLDRGGTFSLFEGQAYLWYQPIWHRFAAWMPGSLDPSLWAALLSSLSLPVFYALLRSRAWSLPPRSAALGALLLCVFAPVTAFSCHVGSEALALLLALLGLLIPATSDRGWKGTAWAAFGGLLFGSALLARLNLAFLVFLAPASTRDLRRLSAWGAGLALPLALGWWRNARILTEHAWVFAWDGLAIRSDTFDPISTLFLQRHPDIQEGLLRLHRQIQPQAEWLVQNGEIRSGLVAFMVLGALAVALCGRLWVAAAGVGTLIYLLLLDSTLSSNFFRVYLGVFPIFFLAIALLYDGYRPNGKRGRTLRRVVVPTVLVAFVTLAGYDYWRPAKMATLIEATPPPGFFVGGDRFAVNSGFYQPESLMYRYRDIRFVGLPMYPEDFPEFQTAFPDYAETIWQPFVVQTELLDFLRARPECGTPQPGANPLRLRYLRIRCDAVAMDESPESDFR